MEGPGMSLFQGAGSIHINSSAQDRLEEQEDLEDQKRRHEELRHKFHNAFDDLIDDDEDASSFNISGQTVGDGKSNGTLQREERNQRSSENRPGLPPYIDTNIHLKGQLNESPKHFYETPKNHHNHQVLLQGDNKKNYSPYAAGDGENLYYQEHRGHLNGNLEANHEHLKLMYERCVKENKNLQDLQSQADAEINSLRARLEASLSDREKTELSLQQAHHLLASSKHQLVELEKQVTSLSEQIVESENQKEQLRLELKSANISLQEVQQRLHTMQVAHTHDTDALFREQQVRHREEVDRLHNDLQKARNRLEEKDNEVKIIEKRCMESEKMKEEVLIDKGKTINKLLSELEQAQDKLVNNESAKLKEKLSHITSERNTLKEQVKEFGSKLEITARDLVLCRQKLASTMKEYENWRNNLHCILTESMPDSLSLGEPPSPGKLSTLKEMLNRYKSQTHKLATLQDELTKRDKKIDHYKKQDSELRSKIEEQKAIELQLTSRMAVLQNKLELLDTNDNDLLDGYKQQNEHLQKDLEECRAQYKNLDLKYTELEMQYDKLKSEKGGRASLVREANADLMKELEKYSAQLKDTLKQNTELKTLYLQACSSRDAVNREIKDIQTKMTQEIDLLKIQKNELLEAVEKEKKDKDRLAIEISNCKEELERANKRIVELQKEFTDKQKEFTNKLNKYLEDEKSSMRKELEACLQCEKYIKTIRNLEEQISNMTIKLATQESNDELMKELKSKAEYFQNYILEQLQKRREQRHVAVNTENDEIYTNGHNDDDKIINGNDDDDCDDDFTAKTNLMLKEKEIREQIAEKFTLEMKTMELNCTKRLKEMENEHISTISKLKQLLEKKAQEVETLKDFILSERAKISQILTSKENEISDLIKDHNELQSEYQQLKDKAGSLKDRYQEKLKSIEDKLKHERDLYKKSLSEFGDEKEMYNNKLSHLESEYTNLKAKYKNAKKTAFMYKDYVQKKDEHVTSELSRIQNEYMDIFMKMENRIKFLVNCRIQQTVSNQKDGAADNLDYSDMLNRLQNDISALAQSKYENLPSSR